MATALLHIVPAVGWLLRVEYVRRRRGRKLPQVPRIAGGRGEGQTSREASSTPREETPKYEAEMRSGFVIGGCSGLRFPGDWFVDVPRGGVWLGGARMTHARGRPRARAPASFVGFREYLGWSFFFL